MPLAALWSGALLAGASAPGPFGPLAFVALVPFLGNLAAGPPVRRALRDGFVAGLVFFGVGFGWVLASEVGNGLALPFAYAVTIPALAAGWAGFAAALAWIAARRPRLALAAAPGLWVAVELARSVDWGIPIPWLHLGYALAEQPFLVQSASVFGVYGLSAWVVAVNAGLVLLPRLRAGARFVAALLLAAPLGSGLTLLGGERSDTVERLHVGAVQPALPERERHVAERLAHNLGRVVALSEPAAAGADLVVWPESAWERALGPSGDAFLAAIAHHLGAPLLTGAWRTPQAGDAVWRNTAVLATADGRTRIVAEKRHPVPVYERAPEGPVSRRLARAGLWSGRFASGRAAEPLLVARAGAEPVRVGVLICVDASYPELAREAREAGARLLVAIANEAGSGAWSAGLQARMARVRAVENRMPVVRVANTGPTLWIDAYGRVVAALAPGEPASAVHALALAAPREPGARTRGGSVALAGFLSAFAIGAARFIRTRGEIE